MKKSKRPEPENAYGKFMLTLEMYEKILHPDFFRPLKYGLTAIYEEAKEEAFKNAKISDEAREIEKILLELKDRPMISTFYYKSTYKKLLKLFNYANTTIRE